MYFPPPFHYQTTDRFCEVRKVFWQFDRQRCMQHPDKFVPKLRHLMWFSTRETSLAFTCASHSVLVSSCFALTVALRAQKLNLWASLCFALLRILIKVDFYSILSKTTFFVQMIYFLLVIADAKTNVSLFTWMIVH